MLPFVRAGPREWLEQIDVANVSITELHASGWAMLSFLTLQLNFPLWELIW